MKPLTDMSVPADLQGVAFDVDDTITVDGELVPCAIESMRALRDAGLHLISVTGRPLGWAEVFARVLPVDIAIGENGAGWFFTRNRRAEDGYFADRAERDAILETHARIRARVTRDMPSVREASDARLRRYDLAFDVAEEASLDPEQRAALEALILSEGAQPVTSSVHCHANVGTWNKANAIEKAAESVLGNFDTSRWVFVGDSGNDVPAFLRFDLSVGVANVREHNLDPGPKYVATAERARGFSEVAAHVLAALKADPS